jgi:hypothetical protein
VVTSMCFKSSVQSARFGVSDWLDTFETRIVEFPTALVNVVQACMVLTTYDGKSLAPFLESAIFRLDSQTTVPIWCVVLLVVGIFQFMALSIGTMRKTYLLRLVATCLSAFVSLAILLALIRGPQPWIVALRYAIPFGVMAFSTAVLYVKHEDAKAQDETEDAPATTLLAN